MNILNKYLYNIYFAISICIISRLVFINIFGDTNLDNEWGTLFKNLYNNGVLAFRTFDGRLIPSVYMPPLYAYYIYFIALINPSEPELVRNIILSQIFISSITAYFFYKVNLFFFTKKISLFSTFIFILFPLYIYSSLQISSINIQIFLNLTFLYFVIKTIKETIDLKSGLILGIICGLNILLRGEFVLIFFFTLLFLIFYKKINFKFFSIMILAAVITISPYLIRNYLNFQKITITKSIGYNLWKGNNIDATVEGSESLKAFQFGEVDEKIQNLKKNKYYDFNYDKIFLKNSILSIKNNPPVFIERYVKKFLSFTFVNFNSTYPNYYHPLNIIPLSLISVIFFLSIIFCFQKKSLAYKYLVFNLFLTVSIFSVFFILPRYKLIILPIQLILINFIITKYFISIKRN